MDNSRIENRLPVAREGLPFIIVPLVLAVLAGWAGWWWAALPLAAVGLFSCWFFRDPDRDPPADETAIVSPADGTVIEISEIGEDGPLGRPARKISIFMSVFNVHVNRAPLDGLVDDIAYRPGRFFNASLDKASLENEANTLFITHPGGTRIAVVQIAGLIARRIVCWVQPGDRVVRGKRFGLIRFGSRLDVYLPPETKIAVQIGRKAKAGQTILGYLS